MISKIGNVAGREGTLDCKLHWYPKFYNNVFLIFGFKTLGTFNRIRVILFIMTGM